MNWSKAINAAERCGLSVLLRRFDPNDPDSLDPVITARVVILQSSEQALEMANLIVSQAAEGRGAGIFYDPQNYLDPAVVDKMVVLG